MAEKTRSQLITNNNTNFKSNNNQEITGPILNTFNRDIIDSTLLREDAYTKAQVDGLINTTGTLSGLTDVALVNPITNDTLVFNGTSWYNTQKDIISGVYNGNLQVIGDFYVSGTTTFINAQDLNIADNIILINSGETGSGVSKRYAGIQIDRGTQPDYLIQFDEVDDKLYIGISGNTKEVAQLSANNGKMLYNNGGTITGIDNFYYDGSTDILYTRSLVIGSTVEGGIELNGNLDWYGGDAPAILQGDVEQGNGHFGVLADDYAKLETETGDVTITSGDGDVIINSADGVKINNILDVDSFYNYINATALISGTTIIADKFETRLVGSDYSFLDASNLTFAENSYATINNINTINTNTVLNIYADEIDHYGLFFGQDAKFQKSDMEVKIATDGYTLYAAPMYGNNTSSIYLAGTEGKSTLTLNDSGAFLYGNGTSVGFEASSADGIYIASQGMYMTIKNDHYTFNNGALNLGSYSNSASAGDIWNDGNYLNVYALPLKVYNDAGFDTRIYGGQIDIGNSTDGTVLSFIYDSIDAFNVFVDTINISRIDEDGYTFYKDIYLDSNTATTFGLYDSVSVNHTDKKLSVNRTPHGWLAFSGLTHTQTITTSWSTITNGTNNLFADYNSFVNITRSGDGMKIQYDGHYSFSYHLVIAGTNSITFDCRLYNISRSLEIPIQTSQTTTGTLNFLTIGNTGYMTDVEVGDVVVLQMRADSGSNTVTFKHGSMFCRLNHGLS